MIWTMLDGLVLVTAVSVVGLVGRLSSIAAEGRSLVFNVDFGKEGVRTNKEVRSSVVASFVILFLNF